MTSNSRISRCGQPTRGGFCTAPAATCRRHVTQPTSDDPGPLEKRDLRATAWWALRGLAAGQLQPREASAVAALLRFLHTAGPEPMDEEEALAEVELRGIIMAGLQPRTPEEWALARRLFSEEALQLLGRPVDDDEDEDDRDGAEGGGGDRGEGDEDGGEGFDDELSEVERWVAEDEARGAGEGGEWPWESRRARMRRRE